MTERVQRLTMSVPEAAAELGISPKKAYELTHAADFPAFKLGTRTLVSRDGLRDWVRKRSEKGKAPVRRQPHEREGENSLDSMFSPAF